MEPANKAVAVPVRDLPLESGGVRQGPWAAALTVPGRRRSEGIRGGGTTTGALPEPRRSNCRSAMGPAWQPVYEELRGDTGVAERPYLP